MWITYYVCMSTRSLLARASLMVLSASVGCVLFPSLSGYVGAQADASMDDAESCANGAPDAEHCGCPGESCCTSGLCLGTEPIGCLSGQCTTACGAIGQGCCQSGWGAGSEPVGCVSGTCTDQCGNVGQPCCQGGWCEPTFGCVKGSCVE